MWITQKPSTETAGNSYALESGKAEDIGFADRATPAGGERVAVLGHKITTFDLEKLKRRIPSWQEGKEYTRKVDGHGTGLVPPDEDGWSKIAENGFVVEKMSFTTFTVIPDMMDHSAEPWFPPIGNQDGKGSCCAWAVAYYMKTYQEAMEHGWNVSAATWDGGYYGHPSVAYQDRIFSPDFVYNLINNGQDEGSSFYDAINLISSIGAASWTKMPYNPRDSTSWPSEQAWREAPLYRGSPTGYQYMFLDNDEDVQSLESWLASDHLALVAVDAHQYSKLTSADIWTTDNYVNPDENHANTIVGYDDSISYSEQGEIRHGAFKIVNSWGVGGWEKVADGCFWISYEAMKQRVGQIIFYEDMTDYRPELSASFRINHGKRGECSITVGMGEASHPVKTKRFDEYINGGNFPFCPDDIILDITEFKGEMSVPNNQSFFLKLYDGGSSTTGTIEKFAVNRAASDDPPINTANGRSVYAYTTLLSDGLLRVLPENIVLDGENLTGQSFSVAVVAEQMSDLYSFSFDFHWSAAYLEHVSHTITVPVENFPSQVFPSPYGGTLHSPVALISENLNESDDVFSIACNSTAPAYGFDGNGTVFLMTFAVKQQGDSQVDIALNLTNCLFYDSFGDPLWTESRGGVVTIPPTPPDTTCPLIHILSPENKTYAVDECPLVFNVNEETSTIEYSLDGQTNITIAGNTTLTNLQDGTHFAVVYSSDTHGNVGKSETTFFEIDTTPPEITHVTEPPATILPHTSVTVNATVTDASSGTRQVILNYTCTNNSGVWNHAMNMTHIAGNIWIGTIPAVTDIENVTYTVEAVDNVGNSAQSESFTCQFQTETVPEQTWIIALSLTLAMAVLILTVHGTKRSHGDSHIHLE
jgi:hypothetical protein